MISLRNFLLFFVCLPCAALLPFVLLLALLAHPIALDDGLRHFAIARWYLDHGLAAPNAWRHLFSVGYFVHASVDPWYLSDLLFLPFAFLPIVAGLKIFTLVSLLFLSCSFLAALYILRVPLRHASIFLALLLFADPVFTLRLLLARPFVLVTGVTLFLLALLLSFLRDARGFSFTCRLFLLALLLIFSVLLSQLFVFPVILCVIGIVWFFVFREWLLSIMLILFTTIGIVLGLFLHPQSSEYVRYLSLVFLRIPFLSLAHPVSEMRSGIHVLSPAIILGCMLVTFMSVHLAFRARFDASSSQIRPFLLLSSLTFFFGCLFLLWMRAIDFFWPLLLLTIASVFRADPAIFLDLPEMFLPLRFFGLSSRTLVRVGVFCVCLLLFVSQLAFLSPLFLQNKRHALASFASALSSVPTGARVLNVDWDLFPPLFAVRPDLMFAWGIDPALTTIDDPAAALALSSLRLSHASEHELLSHLQSFLRHYPSDVIVLYREAHPALVSVMRLMPQFSEQHVNASPLLLFSIDQSSL